MTTIHRACGTLASRPRLLTRRAIAERHAPVRVSGGLQDGSEAGSETLDTEVPRGRSVDSVDLDRVGVSQEYMRSMGNGVNRQPCGRWEVHGLYQMGPRPRRTWINGAQVTGLSNVNNNITAAARFAKQNQTAQNAGIPATPANLYLAHQRRAGRSTLNPSPRTPAGP